MSTPEASTATATRRAATPTSEWWSRQTWYVCRAHRVRGASIVVRHRCPRRQSWSVATDLSSSSHGGLRQYVPCCRPSTTHRSNAHLPNPRSRHPPSSFPFCVRQCRSYLPTVRLSSSSNYFRHPASSIPSRLRQRLPLLPNYDTRLLPNPLRSHTIGLILLVKMRTMVLPRGSLRTCALYSFVYFLPALMSPDLVHHNRVPITSHSTP